MKNCDTVFSEVIQAYAKRMSDRIPELDATIFRTGSLGARDIVAAQASEGLLDARAIRELARRVRAGSKGVDLVRWKALDPFPMVRLARIMALQNLLPDDRVAAVELFEMVTRHHGRRCVPRAYMKVFAECALALGDFKTAKEVAERFPEGLTERLALLTDLANPFIGSPFEDRGAWMAGINRFFESSGAPPVNLDGDLESAPWADATPLGTLASNVPAASVDGPLVTVAMSTWCPDNTLFTAVNSLLRQTWKNLEILIIDDCSPAQYQPFLNRVAELDPRIRVFRQEVNGGTYLIRNRALAEARGRYFTVQDSDDWAHPSRIECQVAAMMGDERLVAVHCKALRTNDQLLMNYPGVAPVRTNESSLLFEREAVVERIGYYDDSRKGADTEYSRRLRRAFPDGYKELPDILTVIRLSHGSLSRGEFKPGWRHPARSNYSRAFERWHENSVEFGLGTFLPRHQRERRFHLPTRFMTGAVEGERERRAKFDCVFAGDFRARTPDAFRVLDAMHVLAKNGRKVAFMQLDSFRNLGRLAIEPFPEELMALAEWHDILEVSPTDVLEVGAMVFTSAECLQFVPQLPCGVRALRSYILADSPVDGDSGSLFDVGTCSNNAHILSSAPPIWVPRSAHARKILTNKIFPAHLAERNWPDLICPQIWRVPGHEDEARKPIGVLITERGGASTAALIQSDDLRHQDVRVWHADSRSPMALVDGVPETWSTHQAAVGSWGGYLADVATVIIDGGFSPDEHDGLGQVLQLLAAGCVIVADASWQAVLYDAAIYAPAENAARVALEIQSDRALWKRVTESAKKVIEEYYGESSATSVFRAIGSF